MDPEPKEDLFYKLTVGETEDYDDIEVSISDFLLLPNLIFLFLICQ